MNHLCTKNPKGRLIERSEHARYVEQNKQNIEANKELYNHRQAIVEHPYGTIKRSWGFNYILTKKGMNRASVDVGFILIAYNLRRLLNILDKNLLSKFLQELALFLLKIWTLPKLNNLKIKPSFFSSTLHKFTFQAPLYRLKLTYI